jgi:hypothetical protein
MKTEVEEFILKTKNNKLTGYEGISPKLWKIFCTVRDGIETLTNMFNTIKSEKEFPLDWEISIIYSIYKGKRNQETAVNYRAFLLLSICGIIFSGILAGRLRD